MPPCSCQKICRLECDCLEIIGCSCSAFSLPCRCSCPSASPDLPGPWPGCKLHSVRFDATFGWAFVRACLGAAGLNAPYRRLQIRDGVQRGTVGCPGCRWGDVLLEQLLLPWFVHCYMFGAHCSAESFLKDRLCRLPMKCQHQILDVTVTP